jgi:hypothetical protein
VSEREIKYHAACPSGTIGLNVFPYNQYNYRMSHTSPLSSKPKIKQLTISQDSSGWREIISYLPRYFTVRLRTVLWVMFPLEPVTET